MAYWYTRFLNTGPRRRQEWRGTLEGLEDFRRSRRILNQRKRRAKKKALDLIEACREHFDRREPAALEAIERYSMMLGSGERPSCLIPMLIKAPTSSLFWRGLLAQWSIFDATWWYTESLEYGFALYGDGIEYLSDEARAFYEALPTCVTIYRGCEAGREYGVSWTTDRAVAEKFAHGTRWPNPNPRMATVQVHKDYILAVVLRRGESEVLLSPGELPESVKIRAVRK